MNWRGIRIGPGAYFSYTDPMFGEKVYRMSEFKPEDGKITLSGVEV